MTCSRNANLKGRFIQREQQHRIRLDTEHDIVQIWQVQNFKQLVHGRIANDAF